MPGGRGNIRPEDRTNGFEKNPSNINRKGRPLKIYTILKKQGYGKSDVKAAFGELAFYKLSELEKVHDDESLPVITRIIANQFFLALKDDDWGKVKEIMEHVIGKPNQSVDMNVNTKPTITIINKTGKELDENGMPK